MTGADRAAEDPRGAAVWTLDRESGAARRISGSSLAARSFVLVRDGARTAGVIDVDGVEVDAVLEAADSLPAAPQRGWAEGAGRGLSATVILCTMGSCDLLSRAVQAVLAQDHPGFDVVVVDNAPNSGRTRAALAGISDARLRIVDESRPGLSYARNRGVLAARGEVVAFTDDDALVDPHWLTALLDPIAADARVAGSTGLPLPLELVHAPQRWFESRGGFPKDPAPRVWTVGEADAALARMGEPGDGGPLYPVATARVGAGVCMAFRRRVLMRVGLFDTALGAGTPARGGEDLDMFARVLREGGAIIHTPDAVLFHRHRTDYPALERQIRGNGSGMAALLCKSVVRRPTAALLLLSRVPATARRVAPGSTRMAGADDDVPTSLSKSEVKGFLEGPWLYGKALMQRARRKRRAR